MEDKILRDTARDDVLEPIIINPTECDTENTTSSS